MADQVHRASDRRPEGNQAHTWLTAGTSEEGQWRATEEGTHRVRSSHRCWQTYTSTTSSICGRIRRRYATGNVVMVRYADDIVIGFDKRYDARRPYSHAAQTEGVRTHGSPGENPSDGVRPLRCRKPCHQGKRQTRNVQLPGSRTSAGKIATAGSC